MPTKINFFDRFSVLRVEDHHYSIKLSMPGHSKIVLSIEDAALNEPRQQGVLKGRLEAWVM